MEYKTFEHLVKVSDAERTIEAIGAVMGNVDDGSDCIHNGAFTKTISERAGRVKYLWQHDASQPPVGTITDMQELPKSKLPGELRQKYPEATGALKATVRFLETPRGNEILQGVKDGAINEHSIGYDPIKHDFTSDPKTGQLIRNLREVRLWDVSPVNWGMNPATMVMKAALPYQDTGKAPDGEAWSAPTLGDFTDGDWSELSDAEKMRIARHYAYTANEPPQTFGDLKLPHHKPAKTGVGPAVWHGVTAAMAALLGARGGVQGLGDARKAVYNHLAKHYAQFEQEPPAFKVVELLALSYELGPELEEKQGRVLSTGNIKKVKEALAVLQELLSIAEPPTPDAEPGKQALTNQRVMQRLDIAMRELNLYGG